MREKIEQGNIYFFYRPRVEEHEPSSPDDVQRLYIILSPHGSHTYRQLIVGQKRLPEPTEAGHDQLWGFVDAVTDDPFKLRDALLEHQYETKTRGTRTLPAARPAGEGVYALTADTHSTELLYVLELPDEPDEVQHSLGIHPEAAFSIAVKNPEQPSPPEAGLRPPQQVSFPDELSAQFKERRFIPVRPPEFLNHPGAEFVLVAAGAVGDKQERFNIPVQNESRATADALSDLHVMKSAQPVEPLFSGTWR